MHNTNVCLRSVIRPPLALLALVFASCQTRQAGGTIEMSEAARIRTTSSSATAPAAEVAPAVATSPSTGDTTEYTLRFAGRAAGRLRQWPDSGGTVTTQFTYNDRGRGPSLVQTLKVDRAGFPIGMMLSGTDYEQVPVRETVRLAAGPLLTWRNEAAAGRTKPGAGYYLPLETMPSDVAGLARALLLAKTRTVQLLPEGTATLRTGAARTVTAGTLRMKVTPYEIAGLGLTPEVIWLDADGRLFASGGTSKMLIRSGFESVSDELVSSQHQASRVRDSVTAARLSRTPTRPVAIVHASLFDAQTHTMKPLQTLVVRGQRIEAVGADGSFPIPADAEIVDGTRKTLLPGFWDMHVHVQADDGLMHLAAGVTTVRDLANDADELLALRDRFNAGSRLGPRIIAAGVIEGTGPYAAPTKVLVSTRDAARAAVENYADKGYEQIKVYSSLDPQLFPTIVRTAHDRKLRVSGHVPFGMSAEQMVRAGADELQHVNFLFLNFLDDSIDTRTPARYTAVARGAGDVDLRSDRVTRFVALLKERDVVVDPTLNVYEQLLTSRAGTLDQASLPVATRMPPVARRGFLAGGLPITPQLRPVYRNSFIAMERLVQRLHEAGVQLVAGTDASAGFSFHRELELYSEAGIPNTDILYIATLGAARVMKHDGDRGSLEVGKLADLVLVDGDPSQRMRDIRRAELVMKGGVIYIPDSLYASVGVKPAPRKGAVPTRELTAGDVRCRGPAVAVKKGSTDPVPLDCSVIDSSASSGRNKRAPVTRPRRKVTPPPRKP